VDNIRRRTLASCSRPSTAHERSEDRRQPRDARNEAQVPTRLSDCEVRLVGPEDGVDLPLRRPVLFDRLRVQDGPEELLQTEDPDGGWSFIQLDLRAELRLEQPLECEFAR